MKYAAAVSAVIFLVSCGTIISPRGSTTREKAELLPKACSLAGNVSYGERVYFRIAADEEALLSVAITRGDALSLAVEDASGRILKRMAAMTPGQSEAIPNIFITNGTYYLRIERSFGGSQRMSAYTVTVAQKSCPAAGEREDNGDRGSAQVVAVPAVMSGYYAPSTDVDRAESKPAYAEEDWYAVDGKDIDSVIDIELSPVPGIRSVLSIADENGMLTVLDGGDDGEGKSLIGLMLPAMARRYVVISAARHASSKFPYQLRLQGKALSQGYAYEPNDNAAAAVTLSEGMPTLGRIDAPRDTDMFRIPENPADAGIRIRAPSDISLTAVLTGASGTVTLHTPENSADIIIRAAARGDARMLSVRGTKKGSKTERAASRNTYEIIVSRAVE